MSKFSSKFKDKVEADNKREKTKGAGYSHLRLPKGMQVLQPKGGTTVYFDVMPYTVTDKHHMCRDDENGIALPGEMWYRKPYKLHSQVGAANEAVVCLQTFGKKCPICEYRAKLIKKGGDEEEIKALKAKNRNLYAIIPLKDDKLEAKPSILDMSAYLFQDMLLDETDENPEYRIFFDPSDEGYTLKVRFSKESFGGRDFAKANRIDFVPRKKGYDDKFLKSIPNLDELLKVLSYEEIEKKFFELDEAEEEETTSKKKKDGDDEDEDFERNTSKRSSKKVTKDEDDEEDEEVEDEEEEEDDDLPKKSKSKKTSKKSSDDDEDDEDDDEDNDEDDDSPENDDDEDDDEDNDEDDEEDEDDELPVKKTSLGKKKFKR